MSSRPSKRTTPDQTARYAQMLSALGTESRLSILRLLLGAYPEGMVVGEIQSALGIAPSTLSHHLERLKMEGLVNVRREATFLRYSADAAALQELLGFLFAECCSRSTAVSADAVVSLCTIEPRHGR